MKDLRRFIKNTSIFLLLTVIFYILLSMIWGAFLPVQLRPNLYYNLGGDGHMLTRIKELEQKKNTEVLILGSSHAYRGIDTRIFSANNIDAFNLGSSSQTPLQTKILIQEYLDKLNPKLVLYEVYPGQFASDGVESSIDLISNMDMSNDFLKLSLKVNNLKVYNTLLFSWLRQLFNMDEGFTEQLKRRGDTYISGGYVEKEMSTFSPVVFPKQRWNFRKEQLDTFYSILEQLKQIEIPFCLVYAPITKTLYTSYENNEEFNKLMRKQGPFLNFNELMNLDDSLHFYDAHHLNQEGVTLFNKRLLHEVDFKKGIADTVLLN